ncbi:MAG: winged helix-turn-helix transcriptional regulator [Chloroflexi bacterium]|nr:winged helix-turn-helix transcriptional regulator [Chloroflexota bacterium]
MKFVMTSPLPDTAGVALKAKFFRGFGDPSRLRIIEALREGPRTVGEIVEITGLSQSNVSNHLACLRDCGLVVAERNGRFVSYQLSDERVTAILTLAESLLADAARGVYECTRYNWR